MLSSYHSYPSEGNEGNRSDLEEKKYNLERNLPQLWFFFPSVSRQGNVDFIYQVQELAKRGLAPVATKEKKQSIPFTIDLWEVGSAPQYIGAWTSYNPGKICAMWEVKKKEYRTSLVVQWLRIVLPMRETWVQSLVQGDSTCHRGE